MPIFDNELINNVSGSGNDGDRLPSRTLASPEITDVDVSIPSGGPGIGLSGGQSKNNTGLSLKQLALVGASAQNKTGFDAPMSMVSKSELLANQRYGTYVRDMDLENVYSLNQPWYKQLGNGVAKFGIKGLGVFAQSFYTIPDTIAAIKNGSLAELSGGEGESSIDEWMENMENAFPNYVSRWEREHEWAGLIPFTRGSANFWGDKIISNLGFTAGAIAGSLAQDAIVGFVTGGIGEVPLIAAQIGKASLYLNKVFTGTSKLDKVLDTAKLLQKTEKQILNMKNLAYAAEATRLNSAFRYGVSLYGASRTEAAIEARDNYRRVKEELFEQYKQNNNGQEPTGADLSEIESYATDAMNVRFGLNMALLTASNAFQFGSFLKSFTTGAKAFEKTIDDVGRIGMVKGSIDEFEKKAATGLGEKVWETVSPTLKNIFAEGIYEEGGQFAAEKGSYDYYTRKYKNLKDPNVRKNWETTAEIMKSVNLGLAEQFGTTEGLQNMVIGAITTLISGAATNKIQKLRGIPTADEKLQSAVNILNSHKVTSILGDQFASTVNSSIIAQEMDEAVKSKDIFKYKNLKADQFFEYVMSRIPSDMHDVTIEQLRMLKDLDKDQFEKMFGLSFEESSKKTVNDYVDALIQKANDIKDTADSVNFTFNNPYKNIANPKTDEEKEEAFRHRTVNEWKRNLIYYPSVVKDTERRLNSLQSDIIGINPLLTNDVLSSITNPNRMKDLRTQYEEEAASLSATITPSTPIAEKSKIGARVKMLRDASQKITDILNNQKPELKDFDQLLNFELSNRQDLNSKNYSAEKSVELFQKSVDINALNRRRENASKSFDKLISKDGFVEFLKIEEEIAEENEEVATEISTAPISPVTPTAPAPVVGGSTPTSPAPPAPSAPSIQQFTNKKGEKEVPEVGREYSTESKKKATVKKIADDRYEVTSPYGKTSFYDSEEKANAAQKQMNEDAENASKVKVIAVNGDGTAKVQDSKGNIQTVDIKNLDGYEKLETQEEKDRKELERKKAELEKQQKEAELNSGGSPTPGTDEDEVEDDTDDETDEDEGKKMSVSELFSSGTSPREEPGEAPFLTRLREFLNNAKNFKNRRKLASILVTPNQEEGLGLKGLTELSYNGADMSESTDIENGLVLQVFVEYDDLKVYFVDKNGKRIAEVNGEQVDINRIVFQTMPTTSLFYKNGKRRYRKDQKQEAISASRRWATKRKELFEAPPFPVKPYRFLISRGIAKVNKINGQYERNQVGGVLIPEEKIPTVQKLLNIITGKKGEKFGYISHNGKNIKFEKGFTILQYGDTLQILNNSILGKKKANSTFLAIEQLIKEFQTTGKLNPRLTTYLQNVLYWKTKKDQGVPTDNQIFFDTSDMTVSIGKEKYDIAEFSNNAAKVKEQLEKVHHAINSNTLKKNFHEKFYEYVVGEDGNLVEKEWTNYQTYLLSSEGRSSEDTPLTTIVAKPTAAVPYSFVQKYTTLQDFELPSVETPKPKKVAPTPPTPPPSAAPTGPTVGNIVDGFALDGTTVHTIYTKIDPGPISFIGTINPDGVISVEVKTNETTEKLSKDDAFLKNTVIPGLQALGSYDPISSALENINLFVGYAIASRLNKIKKEASVATPTTTTTLDISKYDLTGEKENTYDKLKEGPIQFTAKPNEEGNIVVDVKVNDTVKKYAKDSNFVNNIAIPILQSAKIFDPSADDVEIVLSALNSKIASEIKRAQQSAAPSAAPVSDKKSKIEKLKSQIYEAEIVKVGDKFELQDNQGAVISEADTKEELEPILKDYNKQDDLIRQKIAALQGTQSTEGTFEKLDRLIVENELTNGNYSYYPTEEASENNKGVVITKSNLQDVYRAKQELGGDVIYNNKSNQITGIPEATIFVDDPEGGSVEFFGSKDLYDTISDVSFSASSRAAFKKKYDELVSTLQGTQPTTGTQADAPLITDTYDASGTLAPDDEYMRVGVQKGVAAMTEQDLEDFKKWAAENVPGIPFEVLNNIVTTYDNEEAFGVFEKGVAKFYKGAPGTAPYHEVFEGIWKGFLTPDQRQAILNEFKTKKGQFTDRATGRKIFYAEATDQQAKERIADDFAEFRVGKLPARTISEKILKFFRNIIEAVKSFVQKPSLKKDLFKAIDKGKFRQATLPESIKSDAPEYMRIPGLTETQAYEFVSDMYIRASNYIFGDDKKNLYNLEKITGKEVFDKIKEAYIKEKKFDKLGDGRYEALVKRTKEKLQTIGIKFNDDEVADVNDENNTGRNYAPEPFSTNWKKNASFGIKFTIATLPQAVPGKQVGATSLDLPKRKTSSVMGLVPVNFGRMFNTLMSKLSNKTDINAINRELAELAKNNNDYVRLLQRVGKVTQDPNTKKLSLGFNFKDFNNEDWRLFIDFYQTFTKQRPNTVIQFIDGTNVYTAPASQFSAARLLQREWFENIKTLSTKEDSIISRDKVKKEFVVDVSKFPKEVPKEPKAMVEFLAKLGVEFPLEVYNSLKGKDINAFSDAVSSIYTYVNKSESIASINTKTLNVASQFNELSNLYVKVTNPAEEGTHFSVENQRVQEYTNNNTPSIFENEFNGAETLEELKETRPELNDVFSQNSLILKEGGRFFDVEGDKIEGSELKVGTIEGLKDLEEDTGTTIGNLTLGKRSTLEINQNLDGTYYILIPADSSTEWTLNLGNHVSFEDFQTGRAFDKLYNIFDGYLKDEINLALDAKNRESLRSIGSKARQLRFMRDILDEKDVTNIEKLIADYLDGVEGSSIKKIEDYVKNNKASINAAISNFISDEVKTSLSDLMNTGEVYHQVKENSFSYKGLQDKFINNNQSKAEPMNKLNLTEKQLNDILTFVKANYILNNIEMHKLIFGDPYQFAVKNGKLDETKRIKSFLSPRAKTFDEAEFDNFLNDDYNQVGDITLTPNDPGYHLHKNYIDTVTLADVELATDNYDKVTETDGASMIMDTTYRESKLKNAQWTTEAEAWHQWQMAYTRNRLASKGIYTYTNEKLKEADAKLIETEEPVYVTDIMKPIVSGSKYGENKIDLVLDKFSQMPIYYKAVEGKMLEDLYIKMWKEKRGYAVFLSGRKVGATDVHSLYVDGKFNDAPFNNNIKVPWKAWGVQLETAYEKEKKQTRGSQPTKLSSLDLFENGEASPEAKAAYDRNIQALKNYHEYAYRDLLKKLGIEDLGEGEFDLKDKQRIYETLRQELLRREMPQNAKDTLELDENGEFYIPFEASPSYKQIKDIIFSMISKSLTSPKMHGGPKVQAPVTGWEDAKKGRGLAVKTDEGYKKISKKEYEKLSPEQKKKVVLTSDTLKFYTKDKPYMEVMLPNWMRKNFSKKRFPTDQSILDYLNSTKEGRSILTGIGFRIPTQAMSSMDVIRVTGFLPASMGNTIIVPSEITSKGGSDFDIDKLNTYIKSVYVDENGDVRLVKWKGSEEATKQFFADVFDKTISARITAKEKALLRAINDVNIIDEILATSDESVEQELLRKNKGLDKLIAEFDDIFEDAADALVEKIADLRGDIENIKRQVKDVYVDKMYRAALENEYYESMEELLTLPENYERMLHPVDDAGLGDVAKELDELRGEDETKIKGRLLKQSYMTKLRHAFIIAKKWVGIAAVNITGQSLTQKSKVYLDPARIESLSEYERDFLGDGKVQLPHNTVEVNGEQYVSLSGKYTAESNVEVEVVDRYTSNDLRINPNKIYIFGDNLQRSGTLGQAQIRNNPNAFGIVTKLKPTMNEDAFMSDDDIDMNRQNIDNDIKKIKAQNKTVVFPKDGLGTGLAKLKEKAPQTFAYLTKRLKEEFGFDNETGTIKPLARTYISDRLSGYATSFVDVAKDPYILKIIKSNMVVGTFMFLERIGVGKNTVWFMNQPIISEYISYLESIGAKGLFNEDNVLHIKQKFATKAPIEGFDISKLKDNIKDYKKGLTDEQKAEQIAILNEFLKYAMMARHSFSLTQATNYDTTKFSSSDEFGRKSTKTADERKSNIFVSVDNILNNSFIGDQMMLVDKAMSAVGAILKTEKDEFTIITDEVMLPFHRSRKLDNDTFNKIANKVKAAFIDYIIQIKGLNTELKSLLTGKDSVAEQLLSAKTRHPENKLLQELQIESSDDLEEGAKSIRLRANLRDAFDTDMYVDMMRELKLIEPTLYNGLIKIALIQGTQQTSISIRNIIPLEDFAPMIKDIVSTLSSTEEVKAFSKSGAFQRNNWKDNDIVPIVKPGFYLPKDEDKREAQITGTDIAGEDIYQYLSSSFAAIEDLGVVPSDRRILLLDEKYNFENVKYDFVKIPRITTTKTGEMVDMVTGATFTRAFMAELLRKGNKVFKQVYGYKKVKYADGSPVVTPQGQHVYKLVNLYGDGQLATEHYFDGRPSVLNNNTMKIDNEIPDGDLIKVYGNRVSLAQTGVPSPTQAVSGENISSGGSEFAKKLTNPGNNLTVKYKDKTFRNAEHAYQTWKSGTFDEVAFNSTAFKPVGTKPANRNTNYQTMVDILIAKLQQHPELIEGINERGGIAYVQSSTHNVKGDAFWESKGQNKFIEALAQAYTEVTSTQAVSSGVSETESNYPELSKYLNELTDEQLSKLGGKDAVIANYEDIPFDMPEKDYIESLRCKL